MKEAVNSQNSGLYQKFIIIDDVLDLKEIESSVELCIIQTDFSKPALSAIEIFRKRYKNVEVWISSYNLSRNNILLANKMGINTVVASPVDKKLVEAYFTKKYGLPGKQTSIGYDYSEIANCKVMIVDDNSMNIALLEEVLSEFKLNISSFLKPKEAYKNLLHEKYDLFLLDIMMPELSGFDLAQKIKTTPHNKDVPIVFISALSDSDNKIKGYNLGSFAYIEKPFDVSIIKSQIFNILKKQKAQELTASNKEAFLATVAHDLKTPISAGINALNLLLGNQLGELEEDQHEIIEDILNSTKFMQDMVENILCKNRIDFNNINLSKQICSLEGLLRSSIELTKYVLEQKNQTVILECNLDNTLIPLDYLEIQRVIHNLIANSSEYSPKGGKIMINIFKTSDKTCFSVQDFGKGIDLEHHNDVFMQYMSFAKKEKRIGSGLGLYISKKIIEAHNGEIALESKLGFGTKITVSLPSYLKS